MVGDGLKGNRVAPSWVEVRLEDRLQAGREPGIFNDDGPTSVPRPPARESRVPEVLRTDPCRT